LEFDNGTLNTAADSSSAGAATGQGFVTPGADTEQSSTAQTVETQEEQVPFHEHPRWQAILAERDQYKAAAETAKQYEPYAPLVKQLQEEGFSSFEAFQQHMEQQGQQQKAQQAVETQLRTTAAGLVDKVNNGYVDQNGEFRQLDMATAERLFAQERDLVLTKQTQERQAEELMGLKLGQLQSQASYAKMDPEYVREMARITGRPLEQIAKESHDKETKREQQVLANYNAGKTADLQATVNQPQGGSAAAPLPKGMPGMDRPKAEFDAWWKEMERAGRTQ
jgi:hypothetical protein